MRHAFDADQREPECSGGSDMQGTGGMPKERLFGPSAPPCADHVEVIRHGL
ncbi:hypothetical protein [Streptomyces sp. NPDC008317]|uniref:hypothetical protein n=1 Tax=Streptomyces sp. NPDC008317 TaxID=3364827 RepID=UPI0036E548ED